MKNIKVLACITPQANSKRLINKGLEIAKENGGQLHILHVEKGDSVLNTEESQLLLQELFNYGANLGGVIHGLCGQSIPDTILQFISDEKITHLVLGMPPQFPELERSGHNIKSEDVYNKIKELLPFINIIILEREKA